MTEPIFELEATNWTLMVTTPGALDPEIAGWISQTVSYPLDPTYPAWAGTSFVDYEYLGEHATLEAAQAAIVRAWSKRAGVTLGISWPRATGKTTLMRKLSERTEVSDAGG